MTNKKLNGQSDDRNQNIANAPVFTIQNIYIKDASYEAPNVPEVFLLEWQPKVDFDLEMSSVGLENNLYEVTLHVTVSTKTQEDKAAFIIDVKQAGIFLIQDFDLSQIQPILSITAPNIIFPYLRETVSNFVARGGFPHFALPPVNFEALYLQHLEEKAKNTKSEMV